MPSRRAVKGKALYKKPSLVPFLTRERERETEYTSSFPNPAYNGPKFLLETTGIPWTFQGSALKKSHVPGSPSV